MRAERFQLSESCDSLLLCVRVPRHPCEKDDELFLAAATDLVCV